MRLDKLNEMDESRQPAIITFKRGTISKVDHFRIIRPKKLIIMGIGQPIGKRFRDKAFVKNLPDFADGEHRYKFENIITANLKNVFSIKRL